MTLFALTGRAFLVVVRGRVVVVRVVVRVVGTRVEVRVVVGRGFDVVVGTLDSAVVVANVVTDVASVVMVLIFCS